MLSVAHRACGPSALAARSLQPAPALEARPDPPRDAPFLDALRDRPGGLTSWSLLCAGLPRPPPDHTDTTPLTLLARERDSGRCSPREGRCREPCYAPHRMRMAWRAAGAAKAPGEAAGLADGGRAGELRPSWDLPSTRADRCVVAGARAGSVQRAGRGTGRGPRRAPFGALLLVAPSWGPRQRGDGRQACPARFRSGAWTGCMRSWACGGHPRPRAAQPPHGGTGIACPALGAGGQGEQRGLRQPATHPLAALQHFYAAAFPLQRMCSLVQCPVCCSGTAGAGETVEGSLTPARCCRTARLLP
jgi:hypothetical protein